MGSASGAALFWRSSEDGWNHEPLYLPRALLLLRVNGQGCRVETPEGQLIAEDPDRVTVPFRWIEEILAVLAESAAGTERRPFSRPVLPIAVICAHFEYGRVFSPHSHAFPHAAERTDELLVGFHITGFAWVNERWKLVGRPVNRDATWRDWKAPDWATQWPAPTLLPRLEDFLSAPEVISQEVQPTVPREEYLSKVLRIKEHLAAGDIYQANLTTRFEGYTSATADDIFQAGIAAGGERFAALIRGKGRSYVSFSPELLVRRWGRRICTSPIKGTRLRTGSDRDDKVAAADLITSEKERAEHVMIVDLERNDLGRICEFGSIRVEPLMEMTSHSTVLHLESTVWGTLKSRMGLRDIFAAMFPGGSVTGAPKRRALEILGELENGPRGIYCGAMGWVDSRGDVELNLPIRTATLYNNGRLDLHAGGGIVADSHPEREWDEMIGKLRFLKDAVKAAEKE